MMGGMATGTRIGTKIRRARERLGLTQKELGDRVSKSVRTVNDWENDRSYPRSSIGKLEEVLGIALDDESSDRDEQLKEIAELRRRLETLASEISSDDDGESRPRAG